jgi:molybdopterin-containing oxidoreductase family iron-sulfur binding subunit
VATTPRGAPTPEYQEPAPAPQRLSSPLPTAHTLLQSFWRKRTPRSDFDFFWESAVQRGVIEGSALPIEEVTVQWEAVKSAIGSVPAAGQGMEIDFSLDCKVWDGRFGNIPWLQELPDPMTRLTWDNAALVSPRTAVRLAVETGDVVALRFQGRGVHAPIVVVPGQADDVVCLALGYGQRSAAEGTAYHVGANGYLIRPRATPWFGAGLEVEKLGERHALAFYQSQSSQEGRGLALQQTLGEFRAHPERIAEMRAGEETLYPPWDFSSGHQWGMAIDLGRCSGCGSCVVACDVENNIPWLGKDQLLRGRDMHWLRIDRFFTDESAGPPEAITMPVMCVHCENAPCEYVCPVNATVHSEEGLNEMVYNRCVGTRYCSNNCPYKVRRFNYLDYQEGTKALPLLQLAKNPDVSVRGRGVMEKCTYCVQRIQRKRIETRIEGRRLRDGELTTACAQACPSDAIVFGDLNDPAARVTRLHHDPRGYQLLHQLGTRPRTFHLARVKNPNPELG